MSEKIPSRRPSQSNKGRAVETEEAIIGDAARNQAPSVVTRKDPSTANASAASRSRGCPDDDIDLSSEDKEKEKEKAFVSRVKYIKPMYSPSTLGTVRLPTAAVRFL